MLLLPLLSWSQKDHWVLYPRVVDFDAGPSYQTINFSNPSTSLNTPYIVENSVFDEDGDLLFYLQDDMIFDKDGNFEDFYTSGGAIKKEVGIAPVPGQCRTYCIFFIEIFPLAVMNFSYSEVVVNDNDQITQINGPVVQIADFGGYGGLTVSPIVSGTTADRDIYYVNNDAGTVRKIRMSATGNTEITADAFSFPTTNSGFESEVELSPCGRYLGWSSGKIAYVKDLTTGTLYSNNIGGNDVISGLEFPVNCDRLYFTQPKKGIYRWDFLGSSTTLLSGMEAYGWSQLELTKHADLIYCVKKEQTGNGTLWGFDSASDMIISLGQEIPVFSYLYGATTDTYALPDQVDGEGDDFFYGLPPLELTSLDINELVLPDDIGNNPPVFYNCGLIELNVEYDGLPSNYSIEIVSVDPATGSPVYGAPYLDYQDNFGGAPSGTIDLRCLDDPISCDLFDHYLGQTFLITVTIDGRCGEPTISGYFKVFGAPSGPNDIKFDVYAGDGPVYSGPFNDIASPAKVTYFGAVDFSNSSGDITFYHLTVSEVDCITGAVIDDLYDSGPTAISSTAQLNFNLAALEIDGTTNYFQLNNFIEHCIIVTVEIGNNCGTATDYSYLTFREIEEPMPLWQAENDYNWQSPLAAVQVYPNPTSDLVHLRWETAKPQNGLLVLLDQTGRSVFQHSYGLGEGDQHLIIDCTSLPPGTYIYQWQSEQQTFQGKIVKL